MAVVNPKNYFGLEMDDHTKQMFVQKFLSEVDERSGLVDKRARNTFALMYMHDTRTNYVLSKTAQETIGMIKLDKPANVFSMIIENADEQATFLLDKDRFIRYYRTNDIGDDSLAAIYCQRHEVEGGQTFVYKDQKMKDYYLTYETFRIMKDDFAHPDKTLKGIMHEKIVEFIKTLIFVKCSNVESYEMKPMEKARPPKMQDNKWINKSGRHVTLVNADWNRMYVKTEGFMVRGHVRFQRHGKENKLIKIIYIDSYQKKGYKRQFHS